MLGLAYFKTDYNGNYKDNPQKRATTNHVLINQYGVGPHVMVDTLINHRNKTSVALKVSWKTKLLVWFHQDETKIANGVIWVSQDRVIISYLDESLEDLL